MDQYKIAGFWRRVFALVYDALIVVAILFLGGLIGVAFVSAVWGQKALEEGILFENTIFRLFLLILWFSYYAFSWMKGGQTLGMKPWRMYVFDNEGQTINLKQATLRFFSAFLGLGLFSILLSSKKKAIQDRVSNTQTLVKSKT